MEMMKTLRTRKNKGSTSPSVGGFSPPEFQKKGRGSIETNLSLKLQHVRGNKQQKSQSELELNDSENRDGERTPGESVEREKPAGKQMGRFNLNLKALLPSSRQTQISTVSGSHGKSKNNKNKLREKAASASVNTFHSQSDNRSPSFPTAAPVTQRSETAPVVIGFDKNAPPPAPFRMPSMTEMQMTMIRKGSQGKSLATASSKFLIGKIQSSRPKTKLKRGFGSNISKQSMSNVKIPPGAGSSLNNSHGKLNNSRLMHSKQYATGSKLTEFEFKAHQVAGTNNHNNTRENSDVNLAKKLIAVNRDALEHYQTQGNEQIKNVSGDTSPSKVYTDIRRPINRDERSYEAESSLEPERLFERNLDHSELVFTDSHGDKVLIGDLNLEEQRAALISLGQNPDYFLNLRQIPKTYSEHDETFEDDQHTQPAGTDVDIQTDPGLEMDILVANHNQARRAFGNRAPRAGTATQNGNDIDELDLFYRD